MILKDRAVVVSGVGTGLGREISRLALRDGAKVVLAARTESVLETTARELDPSGERVAYARTDITCAEDCEALAALAVERFGAIDAAVQVAAYENVFGGLHDTDFENWRRAFDTNVLGSLTLIRAIAPEMKRAGGGSLVLVGSLSMFLPQLPQAGYAASKGALLSAMYYLAQELGPDRIRVNMVVPSWMWGPPVQGFVKVRAKTRGRPGGSDRGRDQEPHPPRRDRPRRGRGRGRSLPRLRSRARCITGHALMVNGGEMMR